VVKWWPASLLENRRISVALPALGLQVIAALIPIPDPQAIALEPETRSGAHEEL